MLKLQWALIVLSVTVCSTSRNHNGSAPNTQVTGKPRRIERSKPVTGD